MNITFFCSLFSNHLLVFILVLFANFITFFSATAQKKVIESYLTTQKKIADSVQEVKKQKIATAQAKTDQLLAQQQAAQDTIKKLKEQLQKQAQQQAQNQGTTKQNAVNQPVLDTLPSAPIDTIVFRNRLLQIKRPFGVEIGNQPYSNRSEKQWALVQGINDQNSYTTPHQLQANQFVFGWHPYWMGEAYRSYNFTLLSALAYFSYELNPQTGGYTSIHDWLTTPLLALAKSKNKNISLLLTVTNLGYANNQVFLKNKAAQQKLAVTLIDLLQKRKANGVNLDFENIPKSYRNLFTNFVINLATELKKADSSYVVSLAVPALDFDESFDFLQLNNHVAYYVVMGYEFYGKGSTKAGPIAPLSSGKLWWSYDLEQSLKNHLAAAMSPDKMVLALPYYGAAWQTTDLKLASDVIEKKFLSYHTYRYIKKNYTHLPFNEEASSGSRFCLDQDKNRNCTQIWFEDEVSLAKKYDWILQNKLKGVGIWALGYDNGYPDLWKLLATKFAQPLADSTTQAQNKPVATLLDTPSAELGYFDRVIGRLLQSPTLLLNVLTNPSILRGDLFSILLFALPLLGITINASMLYLLFRLGFTFKQSGQWLLKGLLGLIVLCALLYLFYLLFWDSSHQFRQEAAQYDWIFLVLGLLFAFAVGFAVAFWLIRRALLKKELP